MSMMKSTLCIRQMARPPPFRTSASSTSAQDKKTPSTEETLRLFREINECSRKGIWNPVEWQPRRLQWPGKNKEKAYAAYHKLIPPDADIQRRSPWGPLYFVVYRMTILIGGIWLIIKAWEFVVPEQYRLKYKYRHLHAGHAHHEAEHGHDGSDHHH